MRGRKIGESLRGSISSLFPTLHFLFCQVFWQVSDVPNIFPFAIFFCTSSSFKPLCYCKEFRLVGSECNIEYKSVYTIALPFQNTLQKKMQITRCQPRKYQENAQLEPFAFILH